MLYNPAAYWVTRGKAFTGLMIWMFLMVGLIIYGGSEPTPMVAASDPGPGFGERYRHSSIASCAIPDDDPGSIAMPLNALADRDRS